MVVAKLSTPPNLEVRSVSLKGGYRGKFQNTFFRLKMFVWVYNDSVIFLKNFEAVFPCENEASLATTLHPAKVTSCCG